MIKKTKEISKDITVLQGNCLDVMKTLPDNSIDSIITDPPYGLSKQPDIVEIMSHWVKGEYISPKATGGFLGLLWDSFVPAPDIWKECFRVLKPGGTALVFAGSRTQDLMSVSLRFGGFQIKDTFMWLFGSGYPKGKSLSKAIDKKYKKNNEVMLSKKLCGEWLRESRKELKLTVIDVSKHFPSKTGGRTGCVTNWEKGKIPTWKHYAKLKDILKLDDRFDYLIKGRPKDWVAAEREVVGVNPNQRPNTSKDSYKMNGGKEFNITLSKTEEALKWDGWINHGIKPAYEAIIVAVKPNEGTYVDNALKWGVSGFWVEGCRIPLQQEDTGQLRTLKQTEKSEKNGWGMNQNSTREAQVIQPTGRFPANVIFDEEAAAYLDSQNKPTKSGKMKAGTVRKNREGYSGPMSEKTGKETIGDSGNVSRFFYCARASKSEKGIYNIHSTVKPLKLMEYLCNLTKTPTGGVVLDPFAGSGTTGVACKQIDRPCILIEQKEEYVDIINKRLEEL